MKLTCRGCNKPFTAIPALDVENGTYRGPAWARDTLTCPHCGHSHIDQVYEIVRRDGKPRTVRYTDAGELDTFFGDGD